MVKKKETAKVDSGISKIVIPEPNYELLEVTVRGLEGSSLVVNRFSEKTKEQLKERDQNKKKVHEKRDPHQEVLDALYTIPGEKKSYGIPASGFKKAMVQVAKDLPGKEINGALIQRQIFVFADVGRLVRIKSKSGWEMREDMVRINGKTPMIRYRPEFEDWEAKLRIRFDADVFDAQSVLNLLSRAGFGIGWGEMRPEKGYECGMYEITGDVKSRAA